MASKAELSTAWIDEGLHKLRAKFSNVVCFETEDPGRFHQLREFFSKCQEYRRYPLYLYDRWQGLCRFDRQENKFLPVPAGEGDRYAVDVADQAGFADALRDPEAALRHMDGVLKTQAAILILMDLEAIQDMDRDPPLMAALRSWSLNNDVSYQGSAILLLAAKAGTVLDQATMQRTAVVPVDLSLDAERKFVITQTAREHKLDETALHQIGTLVRLTAGLNLHQLETVILECIYRKNALDATEIARLKSELIKREEIVDIFEPESGFEMVGGYEAVKTFIKQKIIQVLKQPERAKHFGVPLPRGLLFFGPPGTGKSLFSKALAGETNLPFINFRTENLYSKFLGESGANFAKAIAIAEKNAPAIVFIDEIDKFGKRRSEATSGASEETRRVYNQILEWLGDPRRKTIVVGTTNRPEDLDSALTRPGRLDYQIPFPYPDAAARYQILRIHLGLTGAYPHIPVHRPEDLDKNIAKLVKHTDNFSGAELEELAHRIRRHAFSRDGQFVEDKDFQEALKNFTINKEERQREINRFEEEKVRRCNEASLL